MELIFYCYIDNEVELSKQEGFSRMLSLAIIPGRHISSIAIAKLRSTPSSLKHQQHDQHDNQDKNQHEDQHKNQQDQNEDQDDQQQGEEQENKENTTTDVNTEEHGQTHEDITPQEHLT